MTLIKKAVAWVRNYSVIIVLLVLIIAVAGILARYERVVTKGNQSKPLYHFYVVAPNLVDPYWKEVQRGMEEAAADYNAAMEFRAPRMNNREEQLRYLDIAILAGVDGIVAYAFNDADFVGLIEKAYNSGIPVVTIENDVENSKRKAFVGANSFLLGEMAGKLMAQATKGKANIAIIMNDNLQRDTTSQNLKLNGFFSAVKEFPEINVTKVYSSMLGIISAEEITQSIVASGLGIDAIYTVDSVDTLGVAQSIVDLNMVGKISLVGYGDSQEILRYIKKGIIYGTLVSNPYVMGYQSIRSLIEIKEKGNASTFLDTEIKVLTAETIDLGKNRKEIGR